jgi:glycosyltransferase involved in cell wall biosynthesis
MEKSIAYLIEDGTAIEGMGKYSRKTAQWYSWEKCIKGYKEIYEELIDSTS